MGIVGHKWIREARYIFAFGAFLFFMILLFDFIDFDVSVGENTSIQIPLTEIRSNGAYDGSYRLKQPDENQYMDYSFDVDKDTLNGVSVHQLFLKVSYFSVQAYELYMNGTYIGGAGDYFDGRSDVSRHTAIFPIPQTIIEDNNTFEFRTRGMITTGIRGQVIFIDRDTMVDSKSFRFIDNNVILFVVYGTLLLSISLMFLSFSTIRVSDKKNGERHIWLSVAVAFLSLSYLVAYNEVFYPIPLEVAIRINKLILFSAGLSMTFTTGLWHRAIVKKTVAPVIGVLVTLLTLLPLPLVTYVQLSMSFMGMLILLNLISALVVIYTSDDEKDKSFAFNVILTIVLTLVIHFGPAVLLEHVIMERVAVGIAPLCMFWFLVTYSMTKELIFIRKREQKEADIMKLQQEHVFKNMGEGFFRVNKDGIIVNVLTGVCNKIFGRNITGENLTELLVTEEEHEFLGELIVNFFTGKIASSVCFELFPEEIQIKDQFFRLTYEPERNENGIEALVVVMSDITEAKRFEMTLSTERNRLKMVVSTMLNRDDMIELLNEFLEFTSDVIEGIFTSNELMNKVHTFKGNFGMYNLVHIVPFLHDVEDQLLLGEDLPNEIGAEMRNVIYKDLEIVTDITGSSFFEDEVMLSVNKHNLEKVYQTVRKYFFDQEASLILGIMEQVFYKSVTDILMFYAKESVKIASRKGKTITIASPSGDEVFIDGSYYKDVFRSLIHVFNNSIEHGIEDEEERMMIGKSPYGELSCNVDDLGNFFELTISDDGRGIDLGMVRSKAINKAIITPDEVDHLKEEELMMLIFEPNFSTKSYADELSGRGVGMAAVKAEVERIGGKIRVSSIMDFGTNVKILLPKNQAKFIKFFSLPILLDLYVESSKIYFKSNSVLDLPLSVSGINKGVEDFDITVILPFKGPKDGAFFFSANKRLILGLSRAMLELEHMTDVDEAIYEEVKFEVMKETLNIIAGNAISLFDVHGNIADIGTPEVVDAMHEVYDYPMLTWSLDYEGARFCLGIVNGFEGEVVDMSDLLNS